MKKKFIGSKKGKKKLAIFFILSCEENVWPSKVKTLRIVKTLQFIQLHLLQIACVLIELQINFYLLYGIKLFVEIVECDLLKQMNDNDEHTKTHVHRELGRERKGARAQSDLWESVTSDRI